jgi:hypothetical protein
MMTFLKTILGARTPATKHAVQRMSRAFRR